VTNPWVAFSIWTHSFAEASLRPWISILSHVADTPKYIAISTLAPSGSVEKYSVSVKIVSL
jgi:hypothetical protein